MNAAYVDPPYYGLAKAFYARFHADAADYDKLETHASLIERVDSEFDCWAMSLHTPSLKDILPLCPRDCRVGAWTKSFASFKPGVNPGYCWEPVIYRGGRKRGRDEPTIRDYFTCPIAMQKGLPGAKPVEFCMWVFDLLGLTEADELTDVFPGTGIVGRAWDLYCGRRLTVAVGPSLFDATES